MLAKWVLKKYSIFIAIILGIVLGMYGPEWSVQMAKGVSTIFMRLLKFVSLPIISLSLMATISGLDKSVKVWQLTKRTLFYSVLTTVMSATLALFLFEWLKPVGSIQTHMTDNSAAMCGTSYFAEALRIVPDNIFKPFVEYHVMSIFVASILIGLSILALPKEHREPMSKTLHRLFLMIMQLTKWLVQVLPVAIMAFVILFVREMGGGVEMGALGKYLGVVATSNLLHGLVLLPLLLIVHRISVMKTFKGMFPVLSLAFFTKSSAACMSTAIQCAEEKLKVSPEVARFTFPMCTTINMNACAAFILTTVLFVAQSNGVSFTMFNKVLWVFIATVSALGNAGVPMGCFLLTNALLTSFNVPVALMGIILPFYGLLDMLETSVNIWSDSCITVILDKWWKKMSANSF